VAADSNAAQSFMLLRRETLEEVLVRKTPRKHPEPEHRPGKEHERNEERFDERWMVGDDQHAAASHVVHCAPVAADSDDAEQSEQPEGESEQSSEQHRHGEAAQERRESIFVPPFHGVYRSLCGASDKGDRTDGRNPSSEAIMKISKVETFLVRWGDVTRPAEAGAATAVVAIHADGLVGLGEASPMQGSVASLAVIARDMAPALVGADALDHAVILDRLLHRLIKLGPDGIVTGALAAIDIALWDLKGKAFRQPIYKLLGGAWRTRIPF